MGRVRTAAGKARRGVGLRWSGGGTRVGSSTTEPAGNPERSDVLRTMFPGLGFIGSTWADRLMVDVFAEVTDVTLSCPGQQKLDLKGVRVLLPTGTEVAHSVITSGEESGKQPPQDLFALKAIRARDADTAWWWVEFESPVTVRRLLVFNTHGWLNRDLVVTVTTAAGETVTVRDPSSQKHVTAVMAAVGAYRLGGDDAEGVASLQDARTWRQEAVADVMSSLRAGAPRPSQDAALLLSSLLPLDAPTAAGAPGPIVDPLTDDDMALLAYLLMAQVARNEVSRSGWPAYRYLPPNRDELRRLQAGFGPAAELLKVPPRNLTRHGLTVTGGLGENAPVIAGLVADLRKDLADQQLTPLIAYGSLLGQVREGHLLAHDDDFDAMVCVEAEDREEFDKRRQEIVAQLREAGWKVRLNGKYWNVHVERSDSGATIDLFFVHVSGAQAFTHMHRMKVLPVPADWLATGPEVEVDGIRINVPAEPEKFLESRYGKGWTESDPYDDWVWPLSS